MQPVAEPPAIIAIVVLALAAYGCERETVVERRDAGERPAPSGPSTGAQAAASIVRSVRARELRLGAPEWQLQPLAFGNHLFVRLAEGGVEAYSLPKAELLFAHPLEQPRGTVEIAGGSVVIVAGVRWIHLGVLGAVALAAAPLALWELAHGYQRERINAWINAEDDPVGSGFQILQAETSIGSGQLWGKGFTHGTQTQLEFLRTPTTDYIFSVGAEELGFAPDEGVQRLHLLGEVGPECLVLAAQALFQSLETGFDRPHLSAEEDVADLVEALGLSLVGRGLGDLGAAGFPLVVFVPGHGAPPAT